MDRRIRAIAADAAIQITVVQTTGMVERARNIHKTLRWRPRPWGEP